MVLGEIGSEFVERIFADIGNLGMKLGKGYDSLVSIVASPGFVRNFSL